VTRSVTGCIPTQSVGTIMNYGFCLGPKAMNCRDFLAGLLSIKRQAKKYPTVSGRALIDRAESQTPGQLLFV
jgi:hypothetical protein